MIVVVVSPISVDGARHEVGAVVDLDAAIAARLSALECVAASNAAVAPAPTTTPEPEPELPATAKHHRR